MIINGPEDLSAQGLRDILAQGLNDEFEFYKHDVYLNMIKYVESMPASKQSIREPGETSCNCCTAFPDSRLLNIAEEHDIRARIAARQSQPFAVAREIEAVNSI